MKSKNKKIKHSKLVALVGPTASGKSEWAIKLAKKFNGEVISADSRQIYRGMDIGTAKPLDLQGVPHWLLDIKNPNQKYTVAHFKKDAIKVIKDVQKRGKLPILCGGTGLYVKAVVDNLEIPKIKANATLRKEIENEIKEKGLDYVFKKLVKLDPEAAYIVDPKNPRRIIRALEVTLLTKKPYSCQRKCGKPLFETLKIGINLPSQKLRKKINSRVEQMIKGGLIEEVKKLIKKYGANQQAFDAIGYREIINFLKNKISLEQAIHQIKINTWRFAKRQKTWFKKDPQIKWVKNLKEAQKLVKQFIK